MNELVKKGKIVCIFCQSTFKDKYKLQRHIQTSKKCLDNRPTTTYNCIWCSQSFILKDDLNKHYKKCECDKEQIHSELITKNNYMIEEKNKQLEEKDKMIKDLQDKLYALANTSKTTTVNNGNTYNVTLKCGKPLVLSKKRFLSLLKRTCNEIYVKQGETGLAKWFMKYACRNNEDEISIQCTDLRRGVLKFINKEGGIKQISTKYLQNFMNKCLIEYAKTDEYKLIRNKIADLCADTIDFTYSQKNSEFMNPQRKFINYILEETYTKYLEEEEDGYISPDCEEDDIIVEKQPKSLISPFSEEKQPTHITTSKPSSNPQNIKKEIKLPQNTEDDKLYDFSS